MEVLLERLCLRYLLPRSVKLNLVPVDLFLYLHNLLLLLRKFSFQLSQELRPVADLLLLRQSLLLQPLVFH